MKAWKAFVSLQDEWVTRLALKTLEYKTIILQIKIQNMFEKPYQYKTIFGKYYCYFLNK